MDRKPNVNTAHLGRVSVRQRLRVLSESKRTPSVFRFRATPGTESPLSIMESLDCMYHFKSKIRSKSLHDIFDKAAKEDYSYTIGSADSDSPCNEDWEAIVKHRSFANNHYDRYGWPESQWKENFLFQTSVDQEIDDYPGEIIGNYPRLQSSFYRGLRRKYPVAFKRLNMPTGEAIVNKGESDSLPMLTKRNVRITNAKPGKENREVSRKSASCTDLRERIAQNNAQLLLYREKLDKSLKSSSKLSARKKVHGDDKSLKTKGGIGVNGHVDGVDNGDYVSHGKRSPESPPDSAIEMDSASLQSIVSGMNEFGPIQSLADYEEIRTNFLPFMGYQTSEPKHNAQPTVSVEKSLEGEQDLWTMEGILESYSSALLDQNPLYDITINERRLSLQERRAENRERELEHEWLATQLARQSSQSPTDEEVTWHSAKEVHSPSNTPSSVLRNEDEIDDTDPRLGVTEPEANEELELEIAERYRKRKRRSRSTLRRAGDSEATLAENTDQIHWSDGQQLCTEKFAQIHTGNSQTDEKSPLGHSNESSPREDIAESSHSPLPVIDSFRGLNQTVTNMCQNDRTQAQQNTKSSEVSVCEMDSEADFFEISYFENPSCGNPSCTSSHCQCHVQDKCFLPGLSESQALQLNRSRANSVPEVSTRSKCPNAGRERSVSDGAVTESETQRSSLPMSDLSRPRTDISKIGYDLETQGLEKNYFSYRNSSGLKANSFFKHSTSNSARNVKKSFTDSDNKQKLQATIQEKDNSKGNSDPIDLPVMLNDVMLKNSKNLALTAGGKLTRSSSSADDHLTPYERSLSLEEEKSPADMETNSDIFVAKRIEITDDENSTQTSCTVKGSIPEQKEGTTLVHPAVVHYRKRDAAEQKRRKDKSKSLMLYSEDAYDSMEMQEVAQSGSNPCVAFCSPIAHLEGSKFQKSNLPSQKQVSSSKHSLFNSAKAKIKSIRKAKSMDHIDQPDSEMGDVENQRNSCVGMGEPSSHLPPPPPPPGKVKKAKSIKSLFSFMKKGKSKKKDSLYGERPRLPPLKKAASVCSIGVDVPTHPRAIGRLIGVEPDGTQTVELIRPPHGPFGIYIGHGTALYNYSVFVTRFSDGHPEKLFAGLLSIGDEILSINGEDLRNLSLDEVYNLMGAHNKMVLRTIPLSARKQFSFA